MTLINKIFTYLLVLVIGIFIGSVQKCGGKLKPGKTDTITVESIKWLPAPKIKKDSVNPEPKHISATKVVSIADLNTYLDSVRFYVDTNRIDSTSYAVQKDSVIGKKTWSQFQYFGKPYYKLVERETTVTRTDTLFAEVKKMHLFIGGEVGGNLTRFDYSVGANLTTKKNLIFGYRYGVNTKTHNIGLGIKVF